MKRSLQLNPDNRPATWEQIRDLRDAHELSPVATTYGTFDADEKAEYRLTQAIAMFDSLPTLQNGKLGWKLADNTLLPLSLAELEDAYQQIKTNRAIRAALLHAKAEQFRVADPAPTPAQLKQLEFWLT